MSRGLQLSIEHTWDGKPIDRREVSRVELAPVDGGDFRLTVDAPYWGDPPPVAPAGRCPRLWEYEVVELFVAEAERPRYTEVELGPSSHFLVLRLDGVRRVERDDDEIELRVERRPDRWRGVARLPAGLLPEQPWRANAFAIHGPEGERRYLAAVPLGGSQPDFHQPDRFPLVLR